MKTAHKIAAVLVLGAQLGCSEAPADYGKPSWERAGAAPTTTARVSTFSEGCLFNSRNMDGDRAVHYLDLCQSLHDELECRARYPQVEGTVGRNDLERECSNAVNLRRMDGFYVQNARLELQQR